MEVRLLRVTRADCNVPCCVARSLHAPVGCRVRSRAIRVTAVWQNGEPTFAGRGRVFARRAAASAAGSPESFPLSLLDGARRSAETAPRCTYDEIRSHVKLRETLVTCTRDGEKFLCRTSAARATAL